MRVIVEPPAGFCPGRLFLLFSRGQVATMLIPCVLSTGSCHARHCSLLIVAQHRPTNCSVPMATHATTLAPSTPPRALPASITTNDRLRLFPRPLLRPGGGRLPLGGLRTGQPGRHEPLRLCGWQPRNLYRSLRADVCTGPRWSGPGKPVAAHSPQLCASLRPAEFLRLTEPVGLWLGRSEE